MRSKYAASSGGGRWCELRPISTVPARRSPCSIAVMLKPRSRLRIRRGKTRS